MSEKKPETERPDYSHIDFGYECDLHFFEPFETREVVNEFIRQAKAKGISTIRLVHGKGRSVKKRNVYDILSAHPDVLYYKNDGSNWGAAIIVLKERG